MKLLDGIFYQYYWAKFSKGFSNRLYQDPFGITCVMSFLLGSAFLLLIVVILHALDITYSLKWLFIFGYFSIETVSLMYFLIGKRYKQIISNEEYNQRYYRIAAILYPILCILFMFACFMVMCIENRMRYGAGN